MWDLIVSGPDHCLSFYFSMETVQSISDWLSTECRPISHMFIAVFFIVVSIK